jgi:hypothetical protein
MLVVSIEVRCYNDPDKILPIVKQIENLEYCDLLDESDEDGGAVP